VAAWELICFLFSVVVLLLVFSCCCLLFMLLFLVVYVFGFRPLGPWFVPLAYFVLLMHFSAINKIFAVQKKSF
jgi:hypothetical protein